MEIRTKILFTAEFETTEDIPESFREVAERLIKTGDHTETALEENIKVMLETEMGAENVTISNVSLTATRLVEE